MERSAKFYEQGVGVELARVAAELRLRNRSQPLKGRHSDRSEPGSGQAEVSQPSLRECEKESERARKEVRNLLSQAPRGWCLEGERDYRRGVFRESLTDLLALLCDSHRELLEF